MKIIIFGTGKKYQEFKKYLHDISNIEVLALIDNDETKWGKILDGKVVDNPANISRYVYDFIVLMSDYAFEMKKQLMDMRCAEDKMIHFKDFFAKQTVRFLFYSPPSFIETKIPTASITIPVSTLTTVNVTLSIIIIIANGEATIKPIIAQ